MDRLLRDLRTATRALARHPSFTLVAVLTLALGIGATTALFSAVYGVLLKPLPYARADQLLAIGQVTKNSGQTAVDGSVSHLNFLDWQREARTLASMALWSRSRFIVTNLGDAEVVDAAIVTLQSPELASNSVEGRMLEVQKSSLDLAGASRLEQIRSSMAGEKLGGAPAQPAVEQSTTPAADPASVARLDEIRASMNQKRGDTTATG